MNVTAEQAAIFSAARSNRSFCVEAGAGCGKTTTNRLIAEALPGRRILYTAFNRSVVDAARSSFPTHVTVKTVHQLAWQRYGARLSHKLETGASTWGFKRAMKERFYAAYASVGGESQRAAAAYDDCLSLFLRFLNSDDEHPSARHVVNVDKKTPAEINQDRKLAWRLWMVSSDPADPAPAMHDVYLKAFALSHPQLPFDTIMVDEAQDLSPVMLGLLDRQDAQRIYVGDPRQAIYGFRDAISAFDHVHHVRYPLTGSWRFGDDAAAVANAFLALGNAPVRLRGLGEDTTVTEGSVGNANGVVARSNGSLIASAIAACRRGRTIGFYGGIEGPVSLLFDCYAFRVSGETRNRTLSGFTDWDELVAACETPFARELRPYVRLVIEYDREIPQICKMLERAHRPLEDAQVRFGTTHTFKGAEVDHLFVSGDYGAIYEVDGRDRPHYNAEAMHLAYVAVTRARRALTLSPDFVEMLRSSAECALEHGLIQEDPLAALPGGIGYRHQVATQAFTVA